MDRQRLTGDAVLYEQSGLKALEETLASFLSGEKSSIFLAAVYHKALLVLHDEAVRSLHTLAGRQRNIMMQL